MKNALCVSDASYKSNPGTIQWNLNIMFSRNRGAGKLRRVGSEKISIRELLKDAAAAIYRAHRHHGCSFNLLLSIRRRSRDAGVKCVVTVL